MVVPGTSRDRLVQRLNAAYAGGLISNETLVDRLDRVLHCTLVDPDQVIGDLQFRRRPGGPHDLLSKTMTAVVTRLHTLFDDQVPDRLLALDWSGKFSELVVGRSLSCDVVLTDPTVSGRHARLISRDGHWVLQDLCSTNGSYLNGRRVGRSELRPGDRLALGETLLRID